MMVVVCNSRIRAVMPIVAMLAFAAVLVRFHQSTVDVESLYSDAATQHKTPPVTAVAPAEATPSVEVAPPADSDAASSPVEAVSPTAPAGSPAASAASATLVAPASPPAAEDASEPKLPKTPLYKPVPTYTPPPVVDPFPLLANSDFSQKPPLIPAHNIPRKNLHQEYLPGLEDPPPLFIGFTRQWPMLLQCVVSYITAGWPAESIYVLENTGVQVANAQGKLSLQNQFYLNRTTLERLGVRVLQTPALLTFSQMQNMFLHTAHERSWPYYYYSHQDVVVFSFEDGPDDTRRPGDRDFDFYDDAEKEEMTRPAAAGQPGYRTIYENSLRDLNVTLERGEKWGFRWYQYDHLTLVNREAMDAIGGWDSLIPYYATDCDMNARLLMEGWTMKHRKIGIINDVSSHLEDLSVLYRLPGVEPKWVDPNPPPPEEENKADDGKKPGNETKPEDGKKPVGEQKPEDDEKPAKEKGEEKEGKKPVDGPPQPVSSPAVTDSARYFRTLVATALEMGHYKYRSGAKSRNSWQNSQRGGEGEPYYYDANGFHDAFWVLVTAGRQIFRMKWGVPPGVCDIGEGFGLGIADQWRVLPPPKKEGE